MTSRPTVHHIPICPFSQRLEILLALKGLERAVDFRVVDITVPRPAWLLELTGGTTSLPVLETEDGSIVKESLVILEWLEGRFPEPPVAETDPGRRAVERALIACEGPFAAAGYRLVMSREPERRGALEAEMLARYAELDALLVEHSPEGTFLLEGFGLAETVFTPLFMRFWFLDYYEGFELPDEARYARVRRWRDACLAHPAAQQVTREQVIKLYVDYAQGVGNGALPPGRSRSSFAFEPHWSTRPWPPRDKYRPVSDAQLGLTTG
jgi:glutathione S-transferase